MNSSPLAPTAVSYTATGLTNGTAYFFTVKAVNAVGAGPCPTRPPATAVDHRAAAVAGDLTAKAGVASAALTWTAPASTGGSAITGYNVYKATTAGGESNTPVNSSPLASTARTFTVTGLTNAVGYYFTVKAVNAIGVGAPSNEASATPEGGGDRSGRPGEPEGDRGHGEGHRHVGGAVVERWQRDHRLQRLQGDDAGWRVGHTGELVAAVGVDEDARRDRPDEREEVLLLRQGDQRDRLEPGLQ